MKKKWLLGGGMALVILVGTGGAWIGGAFNGNGGVARAAQGAVAAAKDAKGDKKADPPLEFAPREVVQPVFAHVAWQGRVLRPAGGAADGGRPRQGSRHAAVA